jgi:hypothetical protein
VTAAETAGRRGGWRARSWKKLARGVTTMEKARLVPVGPVFAAT